MTTEGVVTVTCSQVFYLQVQQELHPEPTSVPE